MPRHTGLKKAILSIVEGYGFSKSFTCKDLEEDLIGTSIPVRPNSVSSVVSEIKKLKVIEQVGREGLRPIYILRKQLCREYAKTSSPQPSVIPEESLTSTEVGESVIKLINKLNREITDLKLERNDLKKQLASANLEVVELTRRSNELSTDLASKNGAVTISRKVLNL